MIMDRNELLSKLTALDFIAVDLALYLDTHQNNTEAIAVYNEVIAAADELRAQYESLYGPLCSYRSAATNPNDWTWNNDPWPWEKEFNGYVKEGC